MFSVINIVIFFLWFLSATLNYADFCYVWQLKEYRWDRFKDFLLTKQGQNYLGHHPLLWRSFMALLIFFWPLEDALVVKYILISIFIIDLSYYLFLYLTHKLHLPTRTFKAIFIIFCSLLIEAGVFVSNHDWRLPLFFLILRFFTLSAIVFFVNQFTAIIKKFFIHQATARLRLYPKLIVIGITGSYGKTSVKHFLTQILGQKFKVIKTPKNINTDIGIARFILRNDFENFDIFIVEMGAYQPGEIKLICDMVKPTIGVLTAINEQHLALFGNIKITQQSKYELLRSLPENGLAVVNGDNPWCTELIYELRCPVQTFGSDENDRLSYLIKETKRIQDSILWTALVKGEERQMSAPIIGDHNIMNIAPCCLIALHLGITSQEIIGRVASLTMPPQSLNICQYGTCTIINDSYNSNPVGFKAALNVLNTFPSDQKRIVITRGMIELGEESNDLHQKIGEEITLVADELVIISKDSVETLARGVGDKYRTNIILKYSPSELLDYVKSLRETRAIILLENRIPELVMKELNKDQKI